MSKANRRHRKRSMRDAMNGKDRPRCTYCGAAMSRKVGQPGSPPQLMGGELTWPFSQDHIVPQAIGGRTVERNMTGCCGPCNGDKGQDDLVVFINRLGERAVLSLEDARELQRKAEHACGIRR